jgi:hypothetical protein
LRKMELSNQRVTFVIDSLTNVIAEAKDRNYQRWPILGVKIWPNYYVGYSFTSEVDWMKNWINDRLIYLDYQWPYNFTNTDDNLLAKSQSVYPNPFCDKLTVQLSIDLNTSGLIELYNNEGKIVDRFNANIWNGEIQLDFSKNISMKSGLYVLRISSGSEVLFTKKIMKSSVVK